MVESNQGYILHIVCGDKFTDGYVSFMKKCLGKYDHRFISTKCQYELSGNNIRDVNLVRSYKDELPVTSKTRIEMRNANKIIVSGLFGLDLCVFLFLQPNRILKKTYIQFWGMDFYRLRKKPKSWRDRIDHFCRKNVIKRCAGLIFLLPEEYESFVEITGIQKKHFDAPVRGDPDKKIKYTEFREENANHSNSNKDMTEVITVVVGNSATDTNCHIEAFGLLSRFQNEKIRIVCPLSYGNSDYRNAVIKKGTEIFGDKFVPLSDFVPRDEYVKRLNECDVGVFYNNRQQGMGNISILLGLGKKVYLREGTSMWNSYCHKGYVIFSTSQIEKSAFEDFAAFDLGCRAVNEQIADKLSDDKWAIEKWQRVLDD